MNYSLPGSSVHGNSPGQNTGVCCHALLQGIFPTQGSNPGLPHCKQILCHLSHREAQEYWNECCCCCCSVSQLCPTLWDAMDCSPPGSSVHGDSPGKNTGVGCHSLLQGIFSTQGLNLGLLHCGQILYKLSYQGSLPGTVIVFKNNDYFTFTKQGFIWGTRKKIMLSSSSEYLFRML